MIPHRLRMMLPVLALAGLALAGPAAADPDLIGKTSTAWRAIGSNDRIEVLAFDDEDIPGISCWVSRAVKGGLSGDIGWAEDRSNASIACRQTADIDPDRLRAVHDDQDDEGDEVFRKALNWFGKALKVNRFIDLRRSTVVYLVYSERLIDGSPKNVISVVTVRNVEGRKG